MKRLASVAAIVAVALPVAVQAIEIEFQVGMLMPNGSSGFDTLPAAAHTRVVTTIDGDFAELRTQSAADKVKGTKHLPNIPPWK